MSATVEKEKGFKLESLALPKLRLPEAKYGVLLTALALSLIYIDGTLSFVPFCRDQKY